LTLIHSSSIPQKKPPLIGQLQSGHPSSKNPRRTAQPTTQTLHRLYPSTKTTKIPPTPTKHTKTALTTLSNSDQSSNSYQQSILLKKTRIFDSNIFDQFEGIKGEIESGEKMLKGLDREMVRVEGSED
jgi:hypothetical protein